jgi:hypothetical protein
MIILEFLEDHIQLYEGQREYLSGVMQELGSQQLYWQNMRLIHMTEEGFVPRWIVRDLEILARAQVAAMHMWHLINRKLMVARQAVEQCSAGSSELEQLIAQVCSMSFW